MIKEACGLFGIINHDDSAYLTFLGLQALQHRGQESCGIASYKNTFHLKREMGLVKNGFSEADFSGDGLRFHGNKTIGHVRYSTTGDSKKDNIQPITLNTKYGKVVTAHNGNLTNTELLRQQLKGTKLTTDTDSEFILHFINQSQHNSLDDAILDGLKRQDGAFCQLFLTEDTLYAARDRYAFHPLYLARLKPSAYIIASETCAIDLLNAEFLRQIRPGELLKIKDGQLTATYFAVPSPAQCAFELVYFSRPDDGFGRNAVIRHELGKKSWEEAPIDADFVSPVPDSGNKFAEGVALACKLPYINVFVRNHYTHRTFINPQQDKRIKNLETKLNIVKELVKGKKIVICDDSIVRGNTCKSRIKGLRAAGAREVHVRVSCPPIISPCYMGIDFNTKTQLIANNHTIDEIRQIIDADSLAYISVQGFKDVLGDDHCYACWTGNYPCNIQYRAKKKC